MCSDILNLREKALILGQNILVSPSGEETVSRQETT
jgi:hypothetical protein